MHESGCELCNAVRELLGKKSIRDGHELRQVWCPKCFSAMDVVVKQNPPRHTSTNDDSGF
jgi:hypothetical protein